MRKPNQPYSDSFKNQVMEDYFSGELSLQACARKWKIPAQSLNNWVKICKNGQKSVSLPPKSKKNEKITEFCSKGKDVRTWSRDGPVLFFTYSMFPLRRMPLLPFLATRARLTSFFRRENAPGPVMVTFQTAFFVFFALLTK